MSDILIDYEIYLEFPTSFKIDYPEKNILYYGNSKGSKEFF